LSERDRVWGVTVVSFGSCERVCWWHTENKTPQQNYNPPILMMHNVREEAEDFGWKTALNYDR
jgi:hypothetical protein